MEMLRRAMGVQGGYICKALQVVETQRIKKQKCIQQRTAHVANHRVLAYKEVMHEV